MNCRECAVQWFPRVLVAALLLGACMGRADAYGYLCHDPSVGINTQRHGGSRGIVARWPLDASGEARIPYWIDRVPPKDGQLPGTIDEVIDAVRCAFAVWDSVDTAAVTFEYRGLVDKADALDNTNVVTFRPTYPAPPDFEWAIFPNAWYTSGADLPGPDGTWVATPPGRFLDCDIVVYSPGGYTLAAVEAPEDDRLSLRGIMAHEIGHMLGLDHSGLGQSTMYAYATWGLGFPELTLLPDDRIGLSTLYPTPEFLARFGRIDGRVVDGDGRPVAGLNVVAVDSATGEALASSMTGLADTDERGVPTAYDLSAGEFRIFVPPGRYGLLVEPMGHATQGPTYMSGIYGSASGRGSFLDTSWQAAFDTVVLTVDAGGTAHRDLVVSRADDSTPLFGRRVSLRRSEALSAWQSPAELRRGDRATIAVERGTVGEPGKVAAVSFDFVGGSIEVLPAASEPAEGLLALEVKVADDAALGARVLRATTDKGVAYFPGAVAVVDDPGAGRPGA